MVINSKALLDRLETDTRDLLAEAQQLGQLPKEILLAIPAPGKWSVAQVLVHLNHYGAYYIPALRRAFVSGKKASPLYRSGWLGDYFTRMMLPGKGGHIRNKMSAPANSRPEPLPDVTAVLSVFTEQQQQLLGIIQAARDKNIAAIRVPVSIAPWIKLRTGDTLRFILAHEQRHFVQIRNILAALPGQ